MDVQIEAFCGLKNRSFMFQPGMTLLQGRNGSGKSTIFRSIEWCLYGYGDCLPRGERKARVSIQIPCRSFSATRKRGPKHFQVEYQKETYIDKEAEEIISFLFGTYMMWKTSCYIPQEQRTRILSGTKDSQMDTLTSLIFSNCDPSVMQQRLEVRRKEMREREIQLKAKAEGLQMGLGDVQDLKMSSEELEKMESYMKTNVENLEQQESRRLQWQYRKDLLQSRQQDIQQKIAENQFEPYEAKEREHEQLLLQFQQVHQNQIIRQKVRELDQKIANAVVPQRESYGHEEFHALCQQEFRWDQQMKLREQLGCSSTTRVTDLQEEIDFLKKIVPFREEWEELRSLSSEQEEEMLSELEQRLKQAQEAYHEAQQNLQLLQCPCCHAYVQIQQGNLVSSSGTKTSVEDVTRRSQQIEQIQHRIRIRTQYERRMVLWDRMITRGFSDAFIRTLLSRDMDFSSYATRLQTIQRVEDLDPPASSHMYQKEMEAHQWRIERDQWKTTMGVEIGIDAEVLQKRIQDLQTFLQEQKRKESEKRMYESQWSSVHTELSRIEVPEDQSTSLHQYQKILAELREKIVETRMQEQKLEQKKQWTQIHQEAQETQQEGFCMDRIKEVLRQVQSTRIDQSLEGINHILNQILPDMFEEEVEVKLRALRETKSKTIKNELNCTIWLHGEEIKGLQGLSVGQASRISMALNIALSSLTPCPFLLFDETFAPVDAQVHDRALGAIQRALPSGRMLICTSHVESGIYDDVKRLP